MTKTLDNMKIKNTGASPDHGSQTNAEHDMYTYVTAGISEHQGKVPVWLWIVVILLLSWGLYYLLHYWSASMT